VNVTAEQRLCITEDRLALEEISEGGREDYAPPGTGRMAQNSVTTPTHKLGLINKRLRESHGPDWIGVQVSG
jgi:hypothetical protein